MVPGPRQPVPRELLQLHPLIDGIHATLGRVQVLINFLVVLPVSISQDIVVT
jgi:hypothetical protein